MHMNWFQSLRACIANVGMIIALAVTVVTIPSLVLAAPFGGRASIVVPCYNSAIYANLGPPIGGPYIWTPATRTYQFGAPKYAGQWLLGLYGAPYYCLVSRSPVITWAGRSIYMMGSSGGGSNNGRAGGSIYTQGPGTASDPTAGNNKYDNTYAANNGGNATAANTKIRINEVFFAVDSAHGSAPANQFVELYNDDNNTIDLSSWTLYNSSGTNLIPTGTFIPPGAYAVIIAASSTQGYWNIPTGVKVITVGATIGGGLSAPGDHVVLRQGTSGAIIDSVSWGTDTQALNPAVQVVTTGHSIVRKSPGSDSDTAADWMDLAIPTPGK
jgi:hypothetical protein